MSASSFQFDFSNRRYLIAGGAGHLGRAVAAALLESGAIVVLLDMAEPLDQAKAEFDASGDAVRFLSCDLADEGDILKACETVEAESSELHGFVHTAAFVNQGNSDGYATRFEDQTIPLWRHALDVNLGSAFLLCQKLTPMMRRTDGASIVLYGSIYGVVGPDFRLYEGTGLNSAAGYAASKGGIIQLTRWLSTALAPDIRVNTVSPGGIERGQDPKFIERYTERCPQGRMGRESDIVGPTLFMLSGLSGYVTGQNLVVDGGWSAW